MDLSGSTTWLRHLDCNFLFWLPESLIMVAQIGSLKQISTAQTRGGSQKYARSNTGPLIALLNNIQLPKTGKCKLHQELETINVHKNKVKCALLSQPKFFK